MSTRMTRLERDQLPEALLPLWDRMQQYGNFADQAGVLAHRPPIFTHVWEMLTTLSNEALLPKRYLELAIVTVSLLNQCDYCVAHHAPKLAIEGISEAGVGSLLDYDNHPELDDTDKLVVAYAIAVTNRWNRTGDGVFEALQQRFSLPQIVELTWRIALCGAFNRFNDILQVEHAPRHEPATL